MATTCILRESNLVLNNFVRRDREVGVGLGSFRMGEKD